MPKFTFSRVQRVEIELKRQPTDEELRILLGRDEDATMFDLPEDLIDWDTELVIDEDYSDNVHVRIPKNIYSEK